MHINKWIKINKQGIKRNALAIWLLVVAENITYLFEIVLGQKYFLSTVVNICKTLWKYTGMSDK